MTEEIKDIEQDVFSFITTEENNYQITPIKVEEGYEWNMFRHIKLTTLYKNSQFETGNSDDKPFKNIIRPILNLQYRAEGFDVKDIILYVNEQKNYYKSFLIKKYHEKWARENGMDTFIDDMVESYVDFGGTLEKKVKGKIPEVVPWQSVAFCDQTDIISGPICLKIPYPPSQLKEMEARGWGNKKNGADTTIDELITLSNSYKTTNETKQQNKTPGRYIEIYELHGTLPDWWLGDKYDEGEDNRFIQQLHIVAFYRTEKGDKQGVCLYKGREAKLPFKFVARDKIFGRALGMGGAEELFESQVWTNYSAIRIKELLDAASKVLLQTQDKTFAKRNKLKNLENLEVLTLEDGKTISQINTSPVNIRLFENSIIEWEASARTTGAANESIMGESPNSGTPFKLQELITAESHSLHEYRKGKLATHLDEIYRDWIIPEIANEINQGQEFLADLDLDEMTEIADNLVVNESNKIIKQKILNGELVSKDEIELFKERVREGFKKGGNKKFIKLLKDEIKDSPLDVKCNIAGKQKYLSQITDKLVNVFRQIFQSPQIMQNPGMAKLFNQIIESSGLSPIDFSEFKIPAQPLAGMPIGKGQAPEELLKV